MNFTHPVNTARVEQNTFCERGLARINVRSNADVTRFFQRIRAVWRVGIRRHGCQRLRAKKKFLNN
jgi:hypothetical protein